MPDKRPRQGVSDIHVDTKPAVTASASPSPVQYSQRKSVSPDSPVSPSAGYRFADNSSSSTRKNAATIRESTSIPQQDGSARSKSSGTSLATPTSQDLARLKEAVSNVQSRSYSKYRSAQSSGPPAGSHEQHVSGSKRSKKPASSSGKRRPQLQSPLPLPQTTRTLTADSAETVTQASTSAHPMAPGRVSESAFVSTPPSAHSTPKVDPMGSRVSGIRPDFLRQSSLDSASPAFSPSLGGPPSEQATNQFPTPNLYDIVLQINAEANFLETWWSSLIRIMRECYHVDRMALALPVDSTDIENIPWGQKASFDEAGINDLMNQSPEPTESSPPTVPSPLTVPTNLDIGSVEFSAERVQKPARPSFASRHSYSGFETSSTYVGDESAKQASAMKRPGILRRKTDRTHARTEERTIVFEESKSSAKPVVPQLSSPDVEFTGSRQPMPSVPVEKQKCKVSRTLRPLETEFDALLDMWTLHEVLNRAKLLVLTREHDDSLAPNQGTNPGTYSYQTGQEAKQPIAQPSTTENKMRPEPFRSPEQHQDLDAAVSKFRSRRAHKEHEQIGNSPWSQSPAPSPAVQADPSKNPFFISSNLDEESFTPTPKENTEDYGGNAAQISAIGVENSSTIIHIPLMNPAAFKNSASRLEKRSASRQSLPTFGSQENLRSATSAPIAILSLRARHVPYPQNLRESLKNLAPHLSTSFSNSYQNTSFQERFAGAFHLHKQASRSVTFAPRPSEGLTPGIESILRFDLDENSSSTAASMLSPSEYSGRSKLSPSSSRGITPAGLGSEEGYFESAREVPSSMAEAESSTRSKLPNMIEGDEDAEVSTTPAFPANSLQVEGHPPRRHSLLHSHGADLAASFNLLPVATGAKSPEHQRRISHDLAASALPETLLPPSERLLRTIIDSLPVQIFTAAPVTGEITWVNSKLLVYCGSTSKELQENQWEAVHPEDIEGCKEAWNTALLTGQQYQYKVRLRRFDGQYRWFFARAAPLKDKFQNIVHWVGTMIDVHDQHLAEVQASKQQETAQSEAKWKGLANSSPQIVFAATRSEGITFCNLRWLEYSGQSEQEAMGAGFLDNVHPEDVVKCRLPKFDDAGHENVPVSVPSDSPRTESFDASARSNSPGLQSPSLINITSSPNGMRLPQRKLSLLASTGILRITRDANGKTSYSTEVRLRMKSGEYRWHLVRVVLADSLDQITSTEATWYGTATDINDHKELEQTLTETMNAKSRFLSNMSHEIRTPLNGIFGMANLLIDSQLSNEQLEQVNIIRASTEGLRDIINDILDLSKVEAGMITLTKDWFHIRPVIEDVNDLTASLAFDKGLELNYFVEPEVPAIVHGDKFRFRQVLLNVIGNAIKFTQEGEIFSRCQIALNQQGSPLVSAEEILLQVDVLDTGPGFDEKQAERLFKRFSQIDGSSTRQHGGSGLGLVISHELVELHGGSMTATGEPGKGATFTFTMVFGITPEVAKAQSKSAKSKIDRNPSVSPRLPPQVGAPLPSPEAIKSRPTHRRALSSLGSEYSKPPETPMESRTEMFGPLPPSPKSPPSRSFSILIACPLKWTRMTAVNHIERVLTRNTPFRIDSVESPAECRARLSSRSAIALTHVVLILRLADDVASLVDYIYAHGSKSISIVIVTDSTQRRLLQDKIPHHDLAELVESGKMHFIFKPVKPSKLAIVFDPEGSRTLSRDQNQFVAQRMAEKQKEMLDDMTRRIGNRGINMLLVEDNKVNQMVMLKLLQRLAVSVETAIDGVECIEKVFSKPPSHYNIILCDLHMPRKDGYQTCVDIRAWEKQNAYRHVPIIALSANVLGEVYGKCVDAGFNSYLTKPIEFAKLCEVLVALLDPDDPSRDIEFMRHRPGQGAASSSSTARGHQR